MTVKLKIKGIDSLPIPVNEDYKHIGVGDNFLEDDDFYICRQREFVKLEEGLTLVIHLDRQYK